VRKAKDVEYSKAVVHKKKTQSAFAKNDRMALVEEEHGIPE